VCFKAVFVEIIVDDSKSLIHGVPMRFGSYLEEVHSKAALYRIWKRYT